MDNKGVIYILTNPSFPKYEYGRSQTLTHL